MTAARRERLTEQARQMQRDRFAATGSYFIGEPDLSPAELERKHVLCYPDSERQDWMRRQLSRWLVE